MMKVACVVIDVLANNGVKWSEAKRDVILKEQIIKEVNTIADLQLLNQLFAYVQVIKRTEDKVTPNRERILQGTGSITDEEA